MSTFFSTDVTANTTTSYKTDDAAVGTTFKTTKSTTFISTLFPTIDTT